MSEGNGTSATTVMSTVIPGLRKLMTMPEGQTLKGYDKFKEVLGSYTMVIMSEHMTRVVQYSQKPNLQEPPDLTSDEEKSTSKRMKFAEKLKQFTKDERLLIRHQTR